jgi:outer membrane biosynthesis protein TonB
VAAWHVVQGSGFPRLDGAVDCVLRRLEFVPGRRDGRAVPSSVLLPIAFRLGHSPTGGRTVR